MPLIISDITKIGQIWWWLLGSAAYRSNSL